MALLVGALTGQSMLQDFVLCLGADGHVAVEAGTGPGGTCETLSAAQKQGWSTTELRLGAPASGSHCGPCRDLAIVQADSMYMRHPLLQIDLPAFSPLRPILYTPSGINPRSFHALYPSHTLSAASSSLTYLRSTILLI